MSKPHVMWWLKPSVFVRGLHMTIAVGVGMLSAAQDSGQQPHRVKGLQGQPGMLRPAPLPVCPMQARPALDQCGTLAQPSGRESVDHRRQDRRFNRLKRSLRIIQLKNGIPSDDHWVLNNCPSRFLFVLGLAQTLLITVKASKFPKITIGGLFGYLPQRSKQRSPDFRVVKVPL